MKIYRKLQSSDVTVYTVGNRNYVTVADCANPFNRGVVIVSRDDLAAVMRVERKRNQLLFPHGHPVTAPRPYYCGRVVS